MPGLTSIEGSKRLDRRPAAAAEDAWLCSESDLGYASPPLLLCENFWRFFEPPPIVNGPSTLATEPSSDAGGGDIISRDGAAAEASALGLARCSDWVMGEQSSSSPSSPSPSAAVPSFVSGPRSPIGHVSFSLRSPKMCEPDRSDEPRRTQRHTGQSWRDCGSWPLATRSSLCAENHLSRHVLHK